MKCPECKIEGVISGCRTEVEGDKSAEEATRVYTVQEISCRNPQCPRHGTVVETLRHLIYSEEER
ncbi:MAG: hypothetical protein SOX72_03740 [Oscillospiraceae bacterium]|nr:hypothetical protein [Oscillospiraceae bacterium]MDY4191312.1 hypothetical protein [Oscillospiraceae bacterium]